MRQNHPQPRRRGDQEAARDIRWYPRTKTHPHNKRNLQNEGGHAPLHSLLWPHNYHLRPAKEGDLAPKGDLDPTISPDWVVTFSICRVAAEEGGCQAVMSNTSGGGRGLPPPQTHINNTVTVVKETKYWDGCQGQDYETTSAISTCRAKQVKCLSRCGPM